MRNLSAILLVATSVLVAQAQESPALSPKQIVARTAGSVLLIEATAGQQVSQGSGFVVDEAGVIVTCLHVIEGAENVAVTFEDESVVEDVVVLAFDVENDLAVLRLELDDSIGELVPLALGDTGSVDRGTRILTIGNPMGLDRTVSEGIVSAWREPEEGDSLEIFGSLPPTRLLQIGVSIFPGSSGGPVLNDTAEVIGVVTSGVLWGMADLNFAIPVDALVPLLAVEDVLELEDFAKELEAERREMARPFFEKGRLAWMGDDPEEAARLVETALQLFSRYEDALLLGGQLAMQAGDLELASSRFELLTQLDEYDSEAWAHLGEARLQAAVSNNDEVALARAQNALRRALELDSEHGRAAYLLALISIRTGNLHTAEKHLILATQSDPDLVDAHAQLGALYLEQGRVQEAKGAFEDALWRDRDHAMSHFGMALVCMELERTSFIPSGKAPQHWGIFLELSEDDPELEKERAIALQYVERHFPYLLD